MRLALALSIVALLLAAPAAAARQVGLCKLPDRAKVEAVGGRLVVFSLVHKDRDDDQLTNYHVCRRASGKRTLLVQTNQWLDYTTLARHVTAAGDYVAYVHSSDLGRDGAFARVVIRDAVRRRERRATIGGDFQSSAYHLPATVPAFALNRRGTAAYVVHHPSDRDSLSNRPRVRVGVRVVEDGVSRLLDKGDGIDPASLRLEESEVRWTNAGEPRSAALR